MDEKDKESGEMANLVPKAFVPLNTKLGRIKHIPKGPFHSKFKQVSQSPVNGAWMLLGLVGVKIVVGLPRSLFSCGHATL